MQRHCVSAMGCLGLRPLWQHFLLRDFTSSSQQVSWKLFGRLYESGLTISTLEALWLWSRLVSSLTASGEKCMFFSPLACSPWFSLQKAIPSCSLSPQSEPFVPCSFPLPTHLTFSLPSFYSKTFSSSGLLWKAQLICLCPFLSVTFSSYLLSSFSF